MARENFRKAGLQEVIELVEDDAGRVLAGFDGAAFDMVFLDSKRTLYPQWWQDIRRVLRPGGLLVADNATSHAGQMAPFLAQVRADATFVHCLATIGKGQFMAVRGAE